MIPAQQNTILTGVGPGTPGGDLLRRYWQIAACADEISDTNPILRVRLLGEDLVLFRTLDGEYGLVGERCPHRLASLANGSVEAEGLRCPYHGWKFDVVGKCLETPNEPDGVNLGDRVRHTGYPVRRLGGFLFAYMGPGPAPALPHWDVLAWTHGKRWIEKHDLLACNWLQAQENSVDPTHLYWLHGKRFGVGHLSTMKKFDEKHDFIPFDYGIMKRRETPDAESARGTRVDQHPLLFPNILRHVSKKEGGSLEHNLQYRVPVDDTHTQVYAVFFEPCESVRMSPQDDTPVVPYAIRDDEGRYHLDKVLVQDSMIWESQGAIVDRSREFLGKADRGVALFRRMLREQIDLVQEGKAPLGVSSADQEQKLIELDVINERIGLMAPERAGAA